MGQLNWINANQDLPWVKWIRGVKVQTSPPTYICTDMLASPIADMPLPVLKGIQGDDHKCGYDPESKIYYVKEE